MLTRTYAFYVAFFWVPEYIHGFVAMSVSRIKSFLLSRHINKSNILWFYLNANHQAKIQTNRSITLRCMSCPVWLLPVIQLNWIYIWSTGSRLVIPIVTVYHFYCNSGFLIPRICNIFSMLVPRQDLSIKINQDQLKNHYISILSLPANSKPNVLFFVYDPEVLFWPEGPFLWLWPGGPFFDPKVLFWPEGPVFGMTQRSCSLF